MEQKSVPELEQKELENTDSVSELESNNELDKESKRKRKAFRFIKTKGIRLYLIDKDMKLGKEALIPLELEVQRLVDNAIMRCEAQKRKVIKGYDW